MEYEGIVLDENAAQSYRREFWSDINQVVRDRMLRDEDQIQAEQKLLREVANIRNFGNMLFQAWRHYETHKSPLKIHRPDAILPGALRTN